MGKVLASEKKKQIPNHQPIKKEGDNILENILQVLYPLALILIFSIVYSYIFDSKLNLAGDNADYYLMGKAIAQGDGYVNIMSPDKPPVNHWPPGYPVIIAGVMKIFGYSLTLHKVVNGLFLLATSFLSFFLFRRLYNNTHLSFVTAVLILLNGTMLSFSTITMSEISFVFFTMLSIIFFMKVNPEENFWKNPYFYYFLASSVFAYHIRTIGIALFGGIFLYSLIKRYWRFFGAYLAGIVCLSLPWFIRSKSTGAGNNYLNQLAMVNPYQPEKGYVGPVDIIIRVVKNIERYISKEIPGGILNFQEPDYKPGAVAPFEYWIAGILAVACIAYGLYKLQKYRTLFVSYIIGNFIILIFWPDIFFGPRFMIALIPFFIFFIMVGLYDLANKYISQRLFKTQMPALLLLPAIFLYVGKTKALHNEAEGVYIPAIANYFKVADWTKKNLPNDVVICCRKPSLFAMFSNRYVTNYTNTLDEAEFLKDLDRRKVDYIVLDNMGYSSTSKYLYPVIKNNPLTFPVTHLEKEPETYLIRYNREISYDGETKNGKKHGFGKLKLTMGNMYEGFWKEGLMHGKGTLKYPDGAVYEGDWENGKREGTGKFTWADGSGYFIGEWKNDLRNGKGNFFAKQGFRWEGTWIDDKLNGEVSVYAPDGNLVKTASFKDNVELKPKN